MLPASKTREILTKQEAIGEYGITPEERPMELLLNYSIINLDKPKGPTSHVVSDYVKQLLHLKKAGHSGTLDPGVTGSLPIAIGNATRIVQAILPAGKEYVCVMHLHSIVSEDKIRKTFKKMSGRIMQLPPIKSAIVRKLRPRTIYYTEILEIDEQDVLFKIGCEAGTYIRKYVHDFGEHLKTGAHMQQLRRTQAGTFDESTLVSLQDLTDALHEYKQNGNETPLRKMLQPVERAVEPLPKVWVLDGAIESLIHGRNLALPGVAKIHEGVEPDQLVAVMTLKNELVALGRAKLATRKILSEEKGIAVDIQKVFYQEKKS